MTNLKIILIAVLTISYSTIAFAKEKEVTLRIKNMTCLSCPFIVKKTLQKVDGVKKVTTSFSEKTAMVIFDDDKTSESDLVEVSTNKGYPAEIIAKN